MDRYDVLMNFTLGKDKYFKTGVFMHEDNKVCEILCNNKFIKERAKPQTLTIKVVGSNITKQISQMNKQELLDLADEEKIKIPDGLTNRKMREYINQQRNKRKGAK